MINVEILRPLMFQGILKSKAGKEFDFKTWIDSGHYNVRATRSKGFDFYVNDHNSNFSQMMAYDASRMASSSFETIINISRIELIPRSTSWCLIKLYYSAFFAAHSILRMFGYVCSQLKAQQVHNIFKYANAANLPNNTLISNGFYCGRFDPQTQILSAKMKNNSHQDTWKKFIECLNTLSKEVNSLKELTTIKQTISSYLDSVSLALQSGGKSPDGNWLSVIRNEINYRHMHYAWHPYGKNHVEYDDIHAIVKNWNKKKLLLGLQTPTHTILKFTFLCTQLINLCYLLTLEISKHSKYDNNMFQGRPIQLLNLLEIRS